ncbi:hypothetical protein EYF80_025964 [Liparis tanakae]|uniref:Uncharacterized protein n=1 Tax=Liparis tanakae TaxID=230148 RepID=A0A4Z2HG13_9TELE|nr:hypothetical protein EYF80_025964 [Liparis tanakae]
MKDDTSRGSAVWWNTSGAEVVGLQVRLDQCVLDRMVVFVVAAVGLVLKEDVKAMLEVKLRTPTTVVLWRRYPSPLCQDGVTQEKRSSQVVLSGAQQKHCSPEWRICVSTPPDTTVHLTRGAAGEEEDRDTKQGMEMELPSDAETCPEWGMFTWSCCVSSAGEKGGERQNLKFRNNPELQMLCSHLITHIEYSRANATVPSGGERLRVLCRYHGGVGTAVRTGAMLGEEKEGVERKWSQI